MELVEIKAEALKWCPYGFAYKKGYNSFTYQGCGNTQTFANGWPDYECTLSFDDLIMVNPEDYTKAAVESLHEVFCFKKVIKTIDGTVSVLVEDCISGSDIWVSINADIMPWKDSYKYTLEVE